MKELQLELEVKATAALKKEVDKELEANLKDKPLSEVLKNENRRRDDGNDNQGS